MNKFKTIIFLLIAVFLLNVGTANATTTSANFPTYLSYFQDGDIINAGDWHNIEITIGERSTTSTLTLFGRWSDLFGTTTMPQITTLANLVTTGALNSGSITSGFGSINIGSSALTVGSCDGCTSGLPQAVWQMVAGTTNFIRPTSTIGFIIGGASSTVKNLSAQNIFASSTIVADGAIVGGNTFDLTGLATFANGFISQASSSVQNLQAQNLYASSTLTVDGLSTFKGGLTVETGDIFTFNGDAFDDLTGTGLTISSGDLIPDLTGGTGITFSNPTVSFDCSEVEGTGINCSGENVTLDATGDWTGTLDSIEGASFLRSDATDTATGLLTFTGGLITYGSTTAAQLHVASLYATSTLTVDGLATLGSISLGGNILTGYSGNGVVFNSGVLDFDCSDVTDSGANDGIACTGEDLVVTVDANNFSNDDWGDMSVSGNVVTLDAGVVSDNEIDYTTVTLSDFINNADFLTWSAASSTLLNLQGGFIVGAASSTVKILQSASLYASSSVMFGGRLTVGTDIACAVTDTCSLGTSALNFSDLFLDLGAVINFDGDITFTHSANDIAVAGGTFTTADSVVTGSLVIPTGTGVTVDAAGEIAVDTTVGQFLFYQGDAVFVIPTSTTKSIIVFEPTDGDRFLLERVGVNTTVTEITCIVDPAESGDSMVIALYESTLTGDFTNLTTNGIDGTTTITCDNDGAKDDGALSNASIDAGDWIGLDIGSVTTVSTTTITWTTTPTRQ